MEIIRKIFPVSGDVEYIEVGPDADGLGTLIGFFIL